MAFEHLGSDKTTRMRTINFNLNTRFFILGDGNLRTLVMLVALSW